MASGAGARPRPADSPGLEGLRQSQTSAAFLEKERTKTFVGMEVGERQERAERNRQVGNRKAQGISAEKGD